MMGMACAVSSLILSSCTTVPTASTDPEAEKILRSMSDKLGNAKTLSFRARRSIDPALVDGAKVKTNANVNVLVARPNRIAATSSDSNGQRKFWYDGQTVTLYDAAANVYASTSTEATIVGMIDDLQTRFDTHPPLADLLVGDPYANLTKNGGSITLAGSDSVSGVSCRKISAQQSGVEWDLWIDANDLPKRLIIRFTEIEGSPALSADFLGWNLSPRVSDSSFKASVPATAQNIQMIPVE